jgi:hypothetical protein
MVNRMLGMVLVLSFFFVITQVNGQMNNTADDDVVTESATNPGVEIVGGIRLIGDGSGIKFPDGTIQITASAPAWYQILPAAERFKLVMGYNLGGAMVYPAVLDKETGLVWQRDTDSNPMDWFASWIYCHQLTLGSRKGWRLPTIEELSSLIDPAQSNPALPPGHPFTNVKGPYWSSSSYVSKATDAWYAGFSNGDVHFSAKGIFYHVRCVRCGYGYDGR